MKKNCTIAADMLPVIVLWTHSRDMDDAEMNEMLGMIPAIHHRRIGRLQKARDRQNSMIAKLLLSRCIELAGIYDVDLNSLVYDGLHKPYMSGKFDFNMSHSDNTVLCALTTEGRIGVDIEANREIDVNGLLEHFDPVDHNTMMTPGGKEFFYYRWTQKESVLKAAGLGLSVPPTEVIIAHTPWSPSTTRAWLRGQTWYLTEVKLQAGYTSQIAIDHEAELMIKEVHLSELLRKV